MLLTIATNHIYKNKVACEPQLGKRNLYPNISNSERCLDSRTLVNILSYSDGEMDLIDIAEKLGTDIFNLKKSVEILSREGLLEKFTINN